MKYKIMILILSIFLITACSGMDDLKKEAEKSIKDFHKSYNKNMYSRIYSNSDDKFKTYVNPENFIKKMEKTKLRLGSYQNSKAFSWKYSIVDGGTFVDAKLKSNFNLGKGIEIFRFVKRDKTLVLLSYQIKPYKKRGKKIDI